MKKKSPQSISHSFSENPGIEASYGDKTWRSQQTIVDSLQNHLDANTANYEKKTLKLVGIDSYSPDSQKQQEIVDKIEDAKGKSQDIFEEEVRDLINSHSLKVSDDIATLCSKLESVRYELPDLKVCLINGDEKEWVLYENIDNYSSDWDISGFRVYDSGSGFDHQLLGMMGASTKKDAKTRRGGLGEGLKMSVAHLLRSGANVRLYSEHEDETWLARPKLDGRNLAIHGKKRTKPLNNKAGSISEILFSDKVKEKTLKGWKEMLDTREGEGLKKYILEFYGPELFPIIHKNATLNQFGVPSGRIYVRGLLLEEGKNMLFSYNLKDKWAINGRDRKTVKKDSLERVVKDFLAEEFDQERASIILSSVLSGASSLETDCMEKVIFVRDKKAWKDFLCNTLNFELGKNLFAPANSSSEDERYCAERGYTLISIPEKTVGAIKFFEEVFYGETEKVSLEQVIPKKEEIADRMTALMPTIDITNVPKAIEKKDLLLSPEELKFCEGVRAEFITSVLGFVEQLDEKSQGILLALNLDNLNISFERADYVDEIKVDFFDKKKICLPEGFEMNYASTVKISLEMLKVISERYVFDTLTQEILTAMLKDNLLSSTSSLSRCLNFIGEISEDIDPRRVLRYTDQEKEKDKLKRKVGEIYEELNRVNVKKGRVEQLLGELKNLKEEIKNNSDEEGFFSQSFFDDKLINTTFFDEGRVYEIDTFRLSLNEVVLNKKKEKESQISQTLDYLKSDSVDNTSYNISFGKKRGVEKITKKPSLDVGIIFKAAQRRLSDSHGIIGGHDLSLRESREEPNRKILDSGKMSYELQENTRNYIPLTLKDGESIRVILDDSEKGDYLLIEFKNGNYVFTQYPTKDYLGRDQDLSETSLNSIGKRFSFSDGVSVWVYKNVLEVSASSNQKIRCEYDKNHSSEMLEENNTGKDFLKTSVHLAYGDKVWGEPQRVFIDAIQNHIDAQKGILPELSFTLVDSETGLVVEADSEELKGLGENYVIIGVDILDQGDGFTTPYLTTLGSTTKGDDDIGKFGEGLKMLTASACQNGFHMNIESRNWTAKPRSFNQTVRDYESSTDTDFSFLGYDMEWKNKTRKGSKTTFSVVDLSSLEMNTVASLVSKTGNFLADSFYKKNVKGVLTKEQMSLLRSKDVFSYFSGEWRSWMNVVDIRNVENKKAGIERFVLNEKSDHKRSGVTALFESPGAIYEKGTLINNSNSAIFGSKMIFGYNIDVTIVNTRERHTYNEELLKQYVGEYFENLADVEVIKKILEKVKDGHGRDFFEYDFLGKVNKVALRQAYYEVFGETAILSLKPILVARNRHMREMPFGSGGDFFRGSLRGRIMNILENKKDPLEELREAVANEAHLENHNLQILPETVTKVLEDEVFTSKGFVDDMKKQEQELLPEDMENLLVWINNANKGIVKIIEEIESHPEKSKLLYEVVSKEDLKQRKKQLLAFNKDNIIIQGIRYPTFGSVKRVEDIKISLREDVIRDTALLAETYGHEVTHFLSGAGDYTEEFNTMMFLLTGK